MSRFTCYWGKFSYLLETRLCKRFDKYHVWIILFTYMKPPNMMPTIATIITSDYHLIKYNITKYSRKGVYQKILFLGSAPGNTLLGHVSANTLPWDCIREYTTEGLYQGIHYQGSVPGNVFRRERTRKHSSGTCISKHCPSGLYQQIRSLGIVSGNTPPRDCIRKYFS